MRHLCFISMVGIFGQRTPVDNSECSVCLFLRKSRCFFLNTPTRSYLTVQFLLLLLVDETDFRRVFPIHPRLVTCSYQCCYPPINKLQELYHIVILCLTDLRVLFHSRSDLSLAFFICSVSSRSRFNRRISCLCAS